MTNSRHPFIHDPRTTYPRTTYPRTTNEELIENLEEMFPQNPQNRRTQSIMIKQYYNRKMLFNKKWSNNAYKSYIFQEELLRSLSLDIHIIHMPIK